MTFSRSFLSFLVSFSFLCRVGPPFYPPWSFYFNFPRRHHLFFHSGTPPSPPAGRAILIPFPSSVQLSFMDILKTPLSLFPSLSVGSFLFRLIGPFGFFSYFSGNILILLSCFFYSLPSLVVPTFSLINQVNFFPWVCLFGAIRLFFLRIS